MRLWKAWPYQHSSQLMGKAIEGMYDVGICCRVIVKTHSPWPGLRLTLLFYTLITLLHNISLHVFHLQRQNALQHDYTSMFWNLITNKGSEFITSWDSMFLLRCFSLSAVLEVEEKKKIETELNLNSIIYQELMEYLVSSLKRLCACARLPRLDARIGWLLAPCDLNKQGLHWIPITECVRQYFILEYGLEEVVVTGTLISRE